MGALGIALGLWIAGPLIAIGDAHPLEGELVRAAIAAAVLVAAALAFVWRWYRRRQSVGAIAAAMTDQGSSGDGDAAILKQRMREALARLRKSAGVFGRDALYDLPWYVIIGPPGSGKTTALINSGLKFSMEKGKTRKRLPASRDKTLRLVVHRRCGSRRHSWALHDAGLRCKGGQRELERFFGLAAQIPAEPTPERSHRSDHVADLVALSASLPHIKRPYGSASQNSMSSSGSNFPSMSS